MITGFSGFFASFEAKPKPALFTGNRRERPETGKIFTYETERQDENPHGKDG